MDKKWLFDLKRVSSPKAQVNPGLAMKTIPKQNCLKKIFSEMLSTNKVETISTYLGPDSLRKRGKPIVFKMAKIYQILPFFEIHHAPSKFS